jgi:F-type H+-transporting ATPase subunit b
MNLTPLVALAEAAPHAAEQQLLDVDGTVFVMLGLFLVTAFVLTQWLWKPYLKVREERVLRVEGYRDQATRLESDAQSRLQRVEAQLAEARRAGSAERAKTRAEVQAREAQIVAEAQAAAAKTLADARAKLETAFAAERARLAEHSTALGREIGEKVLGRKVAS